MAKNVRITPANSTIEFLDSDTLKVNIYESAGNLIVDPGTGNITLKKNTVITGSLTATGGLTGSISGNATTATSASYAATASTATISTNLLGAGGSYIRSTTSGTSYTNHIQVQSSYGGDGNTNIIYAPALGFHWHSVVASNIIMESDGRIAIKNNPGTSYENFAANIVYGYTSVQSPGFYDLDNTAYYLNPAGTSNISSLTTADRVVVGGNFTNNGYNSVASTRLHFGGGDGGAIDSYYIGTNLNNYGGNYTKLDLSWHTGIRMGSQATYGGVRIFDSEAFSNRLFSVGEGDTNVRVTNTLFSFGAVQTPIVYDYNNTAYYLNPAETSYLSVLSIASYLATPYIYSGGGSVMLGNDLQLSSGTFLLRSNHHTGHLVGSYNNVGDNGTKTNPIYTIGSSYNPASASLSDMYGIGYTYGASATFASGITGAGGWGMYVAADGDARIFLNAGAGNVSNTGNTYSPIYYDYNNTSYYVDPASTSSINALTLAGKLGVNNYIQAGLNLDGVDIGFLANTGQVLIGWNKSGGSGEIDLIANRGGGSGGGFGFYDFTNAGAANLLVRMLGNGNTCIGAVDPLSKFVVNGGTVSTTYTTAEARISDGNIHLMKTSDGGVFEAVRAMNLGTTAGTTIRILAAASSDPFNNTNGGKVFIDAVRTATNMDLVFSLNNTAGAAPVERVRFAGSGNIGVNNISPLSKLDVLVSGTALVVADYFGTAGNFEGPTPTVQNSTLSIVGNDTVAANIGGVLGFGGNYNGTGYANWASIKGLKADSTSGNYGGYLSFHTRLHGANSVERLRIADNGAVTANIDMRAPVFYDSANTAYYIDPAGTSYINIIQSNTYRATAGQSFGYGLWSADPITYGMLMSNSGDGTYGGRIAGETTSDYNIYFTMSQGTNRGFVFRNSYSTPLFAINGNGCRATTDIIAYSSSDERLKDNIKVIPNALEKISKISGYEFDWNENQSTYTGHDIGIIAQEIEKVLPEVVTTRDNGYKAVKYEKIVPLLIEAIKEQQIQINELKQLLNK